MLANMASPLVRQWQVVSLADEELHVSGVQLIATQSVRDLRERFFSSDYLFVGLVSELPANPADAPHDCFCIEDAPLPECYSRPGLRCNLVLVQMETSVPAEALLFLQNHLSFILANDVKYYYGIERISAAERAGDDLAQIVDMISSVIVNAVALVSQSGNVLAWSRQYPFRDAQIDEALAHGSFPKALMERLQRENVSYIIEQRSRTVNAQSVDWRLVNQIVVLPVRVQGLTVAQLMIRCVYTPFLYSTERLMEPLCRLLASTLSRRMETLNDRAVLQNLLFAELVRQKPEKAQIPALRERLRTLKWTAATDMHLLVCCGADGEAPTQEQIETLRALCPGCHWTLSGSQLLMLCYPQVAELDKTLCRLGLRAGESWPFEDLLDLSLAREQAEAALAMGSGALTRYGSVFPIHVCNLPQEEKLHFLHPAVFKLETYCRSNDGNLMQTLDAFLSGSDQMSEIAKKLHIHRSTLFYRLGRIREVCGIDLNTGEEKLNLLLSMRLLDAAGRLQ